MTLYQWLQFVLLDRVRTIVAERGSFPASSQVSVYAFREFGTDPHYSGSRLPQLLSEFDDFINTTGRKSAAPGDSHIEPEPPAPTPVVVVAPREAQIDETLGHPRVVAESYWRTRDAMWLHSMPSSGASFDASVAERVFGSVTALVRVLDDTPAASDGGQAFRCLVEAKRGLWVIATVVRQDSSARSAWRVDLPASIAATARMYLSLHGFRPPFTDEDDARGGAMRYWHRAHKRDLSAARGLLLVPVETFPLPGTGSMDEFFWYVDQASDGDDAATVRVLMNLETECKMWSTMMKRRDGAWRVDWALTVVSSTL
jgi:hypothetical protein